TVLAVDQSQHKLLVGLLSYSFQFALPQLALSGSFLSALHDTSSHDLLQLHLYCPSFSVTVLAVDQSSHNLVVGLFSKVQPFASQHDGCSLFASQLFTSLHLVHVHVYFVVHSVTVLAVDQSQHKLLVGLLSYSFQFALPQLATSGSFLVALHDVSNHDLLQLHLYCPSFSVTVLAVDQSPHNLLVGLLSYVQPFASQHDGCSLFASQFSTALHLVHVHVYFVVHSVTALAVQSQHRLLVGLLSYSFQFALPQLALSGFILHELVQLLLEVPLAAPSSHSSQPFNGVLIFVEDVVLQLSTTQSQQNQICIFIHSSSETVSIHCKI
ncbi:hypothetical protein IJ913_00500, partial [bacterium]|nr:hypothetical protein [bacterium]